MTITGGPAPTSGAGLDADTAKLHSMGYAQELRRRMGGFSNFAVSFTIISILSGCLTAVRHRHDQRWTGRHDLGVDLRRADDD